MTTTRTQNSKWFDEAKAEGATHLIIVCDTYDWGDYPVPVYENKVDEKEKELRDSPMQQIMEIYCLGMDKESQLNERRAFHREPTTT